MKDARIDTFNAWRRLVRKAAKKVPKAYRINTENKNDVQAFIGIAMEQAVKAGLVEVPQARTLKVTLNVKAPPDRRTEPEIPGKITSW